MNSNRLLQFATRKVRLTISRVRRWFILPRWIDLNRPLLTVRRCFRITYLKLRRVAHKDSSFDANGSSTVPIDVYMPVVEKDAAVLRESLASVRKMVRHPIKDIYLIAPHNARQIRKVADEYRCKYIDEATVLPLKKSSIKYVHNGENRGGWIFKMLLNLYADQVCTQEHILILDADTVFIRPQVFIVDQKPIFNESPLYHQPYFAANKRLMGLPHPSSLSYITHYMLMSSPVLEKLREAIEAANPNKTWYTAIVDNLDTREGSAFADYEIYADFYLHQLKLPAEINYWLVCDSSIANAKNLEDMTGKLNEKYGAIALHNYDRA